MFSAPRAENIGKTNVFARAPSQNIGKTNVLGRRPCKNMGFTNVFLPEEQKTLAKPIKTIKTKISKLLHLESPAHSLEILVFMVFIGFANVFCS